MRKIIHLADTHIRNLKQHEDYRKIFQDLFEKIKKENVDYIVHCGDIAHTKTQLSPEYFDLASYFLKNLADLAKTIVILGNHDGNYFNKSRQDAISPIISSLNHDNLFLLKDSKEMEIDDRISFFPFSLFDKDGCESFNLRDERINIALYHGRIAGCVTETGWVSEEGDSSLDVFQKFDYTLLGDIHKANQILDSEGRVRYAGSTIQQNFGESENKGFLVWEIENKNDFSVRFVPLINPCPYVSIDLKQGIIPDGVFIPENSKVRLVSYDNLAQDVIRKALDVAQTKYKAYSVSFLSKAINSRNNLSINNEIVDIGDLREISYQEELIRKFLSEYKVKEEELEAVLELNRIYDNEIKGEEEVERNVKWKIKELKWSNFFNYGENNKIDFSKLNGIVGIFGKNWCGKSSIVQNLLLTIFNSISKNKKKSINVVNENKNFAQGEVTIKCNDEKTYVIERRIEKYEKKLKDSITIEAKTLASFSAKDKREEMVEQLSGDTRTGTDKNIRKKFGTLEDFLLTSFVDQFNFLSYIDEGSTKRKEILAKFLDLEIFERKYNISKERMAEIKTSLKRVENRNFEKEILETSNEIQRNKEEEINQKTRCEKIKVKIVEKGAELEIAIADANKIPVDFINIKSVLKNIDLLNKNKSELTKRIEQINKQEKEKQEKLDKIRSFLSGIFDIAEYRTKKIQIENLKKEVQKLKNNQDKVQFNQKTSEKKAKLLTEVPCGDNYPECKFIKDAFQSKKKIKILSQELAMLGDKVTQIEKEIEQFSPDKIEDCLQKYDKLVEARDSLSDDLSTIIQKKYREEVRLSDCKNEFENACSDKERYEINKSMIENKEKLILQQQSLRKELKELNNQLENCENKIRKIYSDKGFYEGKMEVIKREKEEIEKLYKIYNAYNLYLKCMSSDGISYEIIKNRIPFLNSQIADVLSNVVDFEVFFETEGKKLDVLIKHPKYKPRIIEMASGAEKTLTALAIRMALLKVTNLPVSNIFILDEPVASLDDERTEGFIKMLDVIKSNFDIVLLISHLDVLKDTADMVLTIEKDKNGYAKVNI